ncbi:MAG: S8 family peptidase [Vulcanimicrobiota bacterium]
MINRITPNSFTSSMKSRRAEQSREGSGHNYFISDTVDMGQASIAGLNRLTSDDLTPEGKIPIIISNKKKGGLNKLKGEIARKFNVNDATLKEDLFLVDAMKVEVKPGNLRELMKYLPQDTEVVVDNKIKFPIPAELKKYPRDTANRPTLDMANSTLRMNLLWDKGFTGKGVGICVIDSGIHPHKDFDDRIKAFVDMNENKASPHDSYGHGTHVAGIAAGSGASSAGKYKGVAPDADIVGVRITSVSEAIKGIQWAIENKDKYNIKVLNVSLGDFPIKSYKEDPWAQAAEKAWDKGLVVCVAAGNEGPGEGTVSTPGISPKVITVGAMDDKNTAKREDDTMSLFSSRGPTTPDGIEKPDVVAPGVEIFSTLSPNSTLDDPDLPHVEDKYIAISGSSMATPMVSGLSALLLQANPDLTPDEIKDILTNTAEKYLPNVTHNDQGAGLIDPVESLQVALGKKTPHKPDHPEEVPMIIADGLEKKSQNQIEKS